MSRIFMWILVLPICLNTCASGSKAISVVDNEFRGRNFDDFVLAYGPPYSSYRLSTGGMVHSWVGGEKDYRLPSHTNYYGTVSDGGVWATGYTTGGGTAHVECELEIVTGPDGTIRSVTVAHDTLGRFQLSRCAELF